MAKFNTIDKITRDVKSYEGANLYSRNIVEAWFNMLFSSFLENKYYETSNDQLNRFLKLTEQVAEKYGYAFVGKAAIFARNELGMRSISQLTAAWLNDKSFQEKRKFYRGFMHRPDDISEVFSAIDFLDKKRSHAVVKGCADYLSSLGDYQLTKYKMLGHKYNMYDLINITHATSPNICDFKKDMLAAPDTWEVNISTTDDKNKEWKRMVEQHKLGYMALIRNLNNIMACDIDNTWISKYLIPQLVDRKKIRKSLIFPYRLFAAYKNLNIHNFVVDAALGEAFVIATENVPKFDGLNAVVLDVSGSMDSPMSYHSKITLKEVGACFAAILILNGSEVDFIKFGTHACRRNFSKLENPFTIIKKMCANDNCGYGTEISSAINLMRDNYDRAFVISDMQVFGDTLWSRQDSVDQWNRKFKNIMTYSFDLANYSGQIEPPSNNFMFLTALNDVLFKYISLVDGKGNIVDMINNIDF